jgi:hypothetical protein
MYRSMEATHSVANILKEAVRNNPVSTVVAVTNPIAREAAVVRRKNAIELSRQNEGFSKKNNSSLALAADTQ